MKVPKIPKWLLTQTINVDKKVGLSPKSGKNVYTNTGDYKCRVERFNKLAMKISLDVPDYTWVCYCNGDVDITQNSKVYVNNVEYQSHSFDKQINPDNTVHHTVIYLL